MGASARPQICRRLRAEGYDATEPSTHGIQVTSAQLNTGDAEFTRLNIWDFGGQDLYHGTHALFLRTSAVFLLVRARETENALEHEHQGLVFRNQPLPYWLAYVRHLAASDSPVLIASPAVATGRRMRRWRHRSPRRTRDPTIASACTTVR